MMEKLNETKKNFERINYALGPAKHVERKMFCETFGRLSVLDNLTNFRYIGMGSAYFSDFNLFHKILGLKKMLSIEGEEEEIYQKRINFNKPYACIDVEFGFTTKVLPSLPWDDWTEKSIVWLDYVDKIKEYMFSDIETIVFKVKPGSVFLLSVNIEPEDENDDKNTLKKGAKEFRFDQLRENVGKENIPYSAYDKNLNVDNNKLVVQEIINNAILNSLAKRNGGLKSTNQLEYKQLFNLYYRDSADMLTVGGIIYNNEKATKVDSMFENLDFIRTNSETFNIIVPKLTYREIHALDKVLPNKDTLSSGKILKKAGEIPLSKDDIKNYANIYRYFPTFAETNL